MSEISLRNYFAANAYVDWIKDASIEFASKKSDVQEPPPNPTPNQLANFWIKVELKWRWKYADMMLQGKGD